MIATAAYVEQKFREYNAAIFGGVLSVPPIRMSNARTFLGQVRYKRRRKFLGKEEKYDFTLCISRRYDLPQNQLDDVIIHEMIHYYIDTRRMSDTSAHGRVFRSIMDGINRKFNRNITISARHAQPSPTDSKAESRLTLFCAVSLANGKTGVAAVARTRIFGMWDSFATSPDVRCAKWYASRDPFFAKFPRYRSPKVSIIPAEELDAHLKNAVPLKRCGKTIQTV